MRRPFRDHLKEERTLTVFEEDLRGFGLKDSPRGKRTFFVRATRKLGAAEARKKAIAVIEAAKAECEQGTLFGNFADEFPCRREQRRKPATCENNRQLIRRYPSRSSPKGVSPTSFVPTYGAGSTQ